MLFCTKVKCATRVLDVLCYLCNKVTCATRVLGAMYTYVGTCVLTVSYIIK